MAFFLSMKDQEISDLKDNVEYYKDKAEIMANLMYKFVKVCEKEGCVVPATSRQFQVMKSVLVRELGEMFPEKVKKKKKNPPLRRIDEKVDKEFQCENCKDMVDPEIVKFGADQFAICPKCGHTKKLGSSFIIYRKG